MAERRELAERIQMLRNARNWSQAKLAERVEVQPITIHRWESAKYRISTKHLRKLAAVLNTSVAALKGDESLEGSVRESRIQAKGTNKSRAASLWISHMEGSVAHVREGLNVAQENLDSARRFVDRLADDLLTLKEMLDMPEEEVAVDDLLRAMYDMSKLRHAERIGRAVKRGRQALRERLADELDEEVS